MISDSIEVWPYQELDVDERKAAFYLELARRNVLLPECYGKYLGGTYMQRTIGEREYYFDLLEPFIATTYDGVFVIYSDDLAEHEDFEEKIKNKIARVSNVVQKPIAITLGRYDYNSDLIFMDGETCVALNDMNVTAAKKSIAILNSIDGHKPAILENNETFVYKYLGVECAFKTPINDKTELDECYEHAKKLFCRTGYAANRVWVNDNGIRIDALVSEGVTYSLVEKGDFYSVEKVIIEPFADVDFRPRHVFGLFFDQNYELVASVMHLWREIHGG